MHNSWVCGNLHWQGNLFQFWFSFCRTENNRLIVAPLPLFPISCSSLLLSYVPRLTKFGINKGFSPCLMPAFCWWPRNTCGSLSSCDRVDEFRVAWDLPDLLRLVVPRAKRESSSELVPSILFRISSRLPSFARDLVVTGMLSSVVDSVTSVSFNFLKAASKTCFLPKLSPKASVSFEVRSFRASSLSRSSFVR